MVDAPRARRLSKRIGTIVASAIEFEIKDPPLAFVTVTDTKVTGDLHDATVFYTVRGNTLDEEPDYAGAAAALERAKGTLRTKVGAGTGVRFTPTLAFVLEGEGAIATSRKTIGATNPADADPGSLRGEFALAMPDNLVHGSDSPESAEREIGIWFPDGLA